MWKIFKRKEKLLEGWDFSVKEKKLIIKAIKYARQEYKCGKNIATYGLCEYLRYYLNKHNAKCTYTVLKDLYHNPEYYKHKGLKTSCYSGYWWPLSDEKSRLKALDILEKAVINN